MMNDRRITGCGGYDRRLCSEPPFISLFHFHPCKLLRLVASAVHHRRDLYLMRRIIDPEIDDEVLYRHLMDALAPPRFLIRQRKTAGNRAREAMAASNASSRCNAASGACSAEET